MPTKIVNDRFAIPSQREGYDAYQSTRVEVNPDPRYGEQQAARLHLSELFRDQADSTKIVIDTTELADDARTFANSSKEKLTFPDIEPFLTHVGDWLDFDRKEVEENGFLPR